MRGHHPLALAVRRVRLLIRLIGKQPAVTAAFADAEEHYRTWNEHSQAAERFHAIVLASQTHPDGNADVGARPVQPCPAQRPDG